MTGAAGFAHIGFRVGKALKQNRKEPQKTTGLGPAFHA
jgi:hypothetical protein